MAKQPKPPLRQVYIREETRTLLERLCELECRSLTDQVAFVIREACKSRGIDPDDYVKSLAAADETAAA